MSSEITPATAPVAPEKESKTMTSFRRLATRAICAVAATVALAGSATAAPAAAAPAFELDVARSPTNFVPGKRAQLRFTVRNLAATPSSGPVTVAIDPLPSGLTATDLGTSAGFWNCDLPTLTCTTTKTFGPGQAPSEGVGGAPFLVNQIRLGLNVDPGATGTKEILATVSGGGANPVSSVSEALVAADQPGFGIVPGTFKAEAYDRDGLPIRQAGRTPFIATVSFDLTQGFRTDLPFYFYPVDNLHTIRTKLPRGLVGNPEATPKCPFSTFLAPLPGFVNNICPVASQVGMIDLGLINFGLVPTGFHVPVYSLDPPRGIAAVFGFQVAGRPILITVRDLDPSDNSVIAYVEDINETLPVLEQDLTLWGNPADPAHDADRMIPGAEAWGTTSEGLPSAFLRMPTECNVGGTNSLQVGSWQNRKLLTVPQISPDPPAQMSGCNQLEFDPEIAVKPTTNVADAPSGLEFDLHVPQNQDPEGLSVAHLRDATVTLPAGMTVNPPSADGLQACSPAQIGLVSAIGNPVAHFNGTSPACPDASKLGMVVARTPILDRPLPGDVYLAEQENNPFGSLIAMYMVIEDPSSDVMVKLAGRVTPDPQTGQLTASFAENPQTPVEDLHLEFFRGPRASLKTPAECGNHTVNGTMVPWSSPEGATVPVSSSFELTQSPGGGACLPSAGSAPNSPAFTAGTVDPTAKAFTPFTLKLTRADGTQQLKAIDTTLPKGLLGKLAGTTYCSDSALSSAAGKSGTDERGSASCPASSRVGSVTVGSGAGSTPLYVGGTAYLAGPYKGAPLSLAFITPAVAGPFDLGTVVVRAKLDVNPESAQIHAVSDELPTILQGIPLNIRSVALKMDRPDFTLNPTRCDPMKVEGSATSIFNQSAGLSSPFQVGECNKLGFRPALKLKLKGGTKRSDFPALTATLTARPGDANIGKTVVALPRSEFLAQSHIRTICTRVQYAADQCPEASIYGKATAWSPLLDQPLSGPVYLRSSSNPLPDMVVALEGQIDVDLVGRIDSFKKGIRTTFDTVPDAPVSKFVLEMQGGKKGLLENSRNLCKTTNKATVEMTGQNGVAYDSTPALQAKCPKQKRAKKKHAKKRGAKTGKKG